jgi:NAD dependent epimerase/dehydratase family enzyme
MHAVIGTVEIDANRADEAHELLNSCPRPTSSQPTSPGGTTTAPNPIQNRDMLPTLRAALHRPWFPPTPKPFVHVGARFMRTDPALALTGRRCVPRRLLDAGFEFRFPTFAQALADLTARAT